MSRAVAVSVEAKRARRPRDGRDQANDDGRSSTRRRPDRRRLEPLRPGTVPARNGRGVRARIARSADRRHARRPHRDGEDRACAHEGVPGLLRAPGAHGGRSGAPLEHEKFLTACGLRSGTVEDYTSKYKGEQVEVALFGGEYQEGVLTAYCYVDEVAHIELNGHILVPLQNIASLHCSSRCDAQANEDWPPRGLLDDNGGGGPDPDDP